MAASRHMNPYVVGPRTGSSPFPLVYSAWGKGVGRIEVRASSLVIPRQLLQPFPLFPFMTKNHQHNLLPFHQIKQLVRAGADRFGVRVAPVVLLVTGKALGE